jgi:hypothetical protein
MLIATGRLTVLRGHVAAADSGGSGIRVRIDDGGTATDLAAGWLVNCAGPAADITATTGPLPAHQPGPGGARQRRVDPAGVPGA